MPDVNGLAKPDRVVVINDDAVARGGAAAIAVASTKLLRARGVAVTFLTGMAPADPGLEACGARVAVLGGRHLLDRSMGSAISKGLFDPDTKLALTRWIDANDTPETVYHLHNWHKVLSPSVFVPLRRVAGRLLMSTHDYFLACPNGAYFHYPQQRDCELRPGGLACVATACDRRHYGHKLWRVARHALRHHLFDLTTTPAQIVAVHETMMPFLARGAIDPGRIRVLRNPVTPWRSTRVRAENNRDVFYVGRLDGDKGVDLLARAAKRAGAKLRVIGDGPLAGAIARDCPDAELLGWRGRDEIVELVAAARMVVSPSVIRETFGLVAFEALMSGIPAIVARSSPFAGEIVDRELGLACDPHDEQALADAIATLLHDDPLVRRMSRRAFEEVRQLAPTPEQWCDDLLALYRERLGSGGGDARPADAEVGVGGGLS